MGHRGVVVALFALVSGLFGTSAAIAADPESDSTALVAAERSSAGLPGYSTAGDLVDVARAHARRMAAEQRLYHNPSLGSQVQGWQAVGENVGVGASVEDIHRAFMASSTHRAAILSTDFTQIGVGVATSSDGRLWVAQVFRRPSGGAAAAPAPAPAPRAAPAPKPAPAPVDPAVAAERAAAREAARAAQAAAAQSAAAEAARIAEAARVAAAEAVARDQAAAASVREQLAADLATPASIAPSRPQAAVLSSIEAAAPTSERDVTLPIGAAAGLLNLVVLLLVRQVRRSAGYEPSDWRRQRNQASMSSSRSPSKTAWTLPVS